MFSYLSTCSTYIAVGVAFIIIFVPFYYSYVTAFATLGIASIIVAMTSRRHSNFTAHVAVYVHTFVIVGMISRCFYLYSAYVTFNVTSAVNDVTVCFSYATAFVAICVASVVVNVVFYLPYITALVTLGIASVFVMVSSIPYLTTFIAVYVARVIKDVIRDVSSLTAFVTVYIARVVVKVIFYFSYIATFVTIYVTSVIINMYTFFFFGDGWIFIVFYLAVRRTIVRLFVGKSLFVILVVTCRLFGNTQVVHNERTRTKGRYHNKQKAYY